MARYHTLYPGETDQLVNYEFEQVLEGESVLSVVEKYREAVVDSAMFEHLVYGLDDDLDVSFKRDFHHKLVQADRRKVGDILQGEIGAFNEFFIQSAEKPTAKDKREFINTYGHYVNSLYHMPMLGEVALAYCSEDVVGGQNQDETISREAEEVLVAAALVHDLGRIVIPASDEELDPFIRHLEKEAFELLTEDIFQDEVFRRGTISKTVFDINRLFSNSKIDSLTRHFETIQQLGRVLACKAIYEDVERQYLNGAIDDVTIGLNIIEYVNRTDIARLKRDIPHSPFVEKVLSDVIVLEFSGIFSRTLSKEVENK